MMKKIIAIAATMMLIPLAACGTTFEYGQEESLIDTVVAYEAQPVTENRFLSYDFNAVSSPVELNEDAVPVKSELPPAYQWVDHNEPQSMKEIMSWATQIGIVTITGSEPFQHLTGDSELDKKIAEKSGVANSVTGTAFEAKVLYPLAGTLTEGDTIKIYYPTGDWGVELMEGNDYLVTLTEWGDSYKLSWDMNSVFDIDDNFIVTSQSSMMVAAKFNGLSLADASYLLCRDFPDIV